MTTPNPIITALHAENLRYWQESVAARAMGEPIASLWARGEVSEHEFLHRVREELFRPFALLSRRSPLTFRDVPHPRRGRAVTCADGRSQLDLSTMVQWTTTLHPELTSAEWVTWSRIRAAATLAARHLWLQPAGDASVTTEQRRHQGRCSECRKTAHQHAALVRVWWADRVLSREYLL